jgi:hypothetical protein
VVTNYIAILLLACGIIIRIDLFLNNNYIKKILEKKKILLLYAFIF